jgi:ubiquinone/menaquinone biosynthesis C-methylase UbiE
MPLTCALDALSRLRGLGGLRLVLAAPRGIAGRATADRALEIGFGPGNAIAELARSGAGHVYGIDHSAVMLRQASRRNAAAIRADLVALINAPAAQLPAALDGPFDAILAVVIRLRVYPTARQGPRT